jgi:hypothetical protein
LTVLPSNRITVDDIATHWWVNIGYKYPPVHYYIAPMEKNGTTTSSNPPPALTYNGTKKITSITSEPKAKAITPPVPIHSHPLPPPPPPVILSSPRVQNGRLTDTESKSKGKKNGHHQIKGTHRLNDNTTTININNNKNETLKSNQSSRWTSNNNKQHGGISSKHPPPRTIVY